MLGKELEHMLAPCSSLAFGFAIHVKACPTLGEHLVIWDFCQKNLSRGIPFSAVLWQVMFCPFFSSVPEQPRAGDSALGKMGSFFGQLEFSVGSSQYPDPRQGHSLLLVLLQSLQCWVLIDHCLQSRKRRDCSSQTELINLKAQVDESMLHTITLS